MWISLKFRYSDEPPRALQTEPCLGGNHWGWWCCSHLRWDYDDDDDDVELTRSARHLGVELHLELDPQRWRREANILPTPFHKNQHWDLILTVNPVPADLHCSLQFARGEVSEDLKQHLVRKVGYRYGRHHWHWHLFLYPCLLLPLCFLLMSGCPCLEACTPIEVGLSAACFSADCTASRLRLLGLKLKRNMRSSPQHQLSAATADIEKT